MTCSSRPLEQYKIQAQAGAAGAVNCHLILRNWLVGAYLIETDRAAWEKNHP